MCVNALRLQGAVERHELRRRGIGDRKRGRRVLLRARGEEKKTKKNETESRHHAQVCPATSKYDTTRRRRP